MSQQRMPHPLELFAGIFQDETNLNAKIEMLKSILTQSQQQAQHLQMELDKAKKRISELEPNPKKLPSTGGKV